MIITHPFILAYTPLFPTPFAQVESDFFIPVVCLPIACNLSAIFSQTLGTPKTEVGLISFQVLTKVPWNQKLINRKISSILFKLVLIFLWYIKLFFLVLENRVPLKPVLVESQFFSQGKKSSQGRNEPVHFFCHGKNQPVYVLPLSPQIFFSFPPHHTIPPTPPPHTSFPRDFFSSRLNQFPPPAPQPPILDLFLFLFSLGRNWLVNPL